MKVDWVPVKSTKGLEDWGSKQIETHGLGLFVPKFVTSNMGMGQNPGT